MKKLFLLLVCVFTMQSMMADNDKPIAFNQLPAAAQQFITKYFPNAKVAFSKMESKLFGSTYDVVFINGDQLEFDKQGEWTEINCKHQSVPEAVVPAQIKQFVSSNYPDAKFLSIERDRDSYEVKLSNFWEIKFDKKFNVIDMDSDD